MPLEIQKLQDLIWLAETNFWIFKRIYDEHYKNTESHNNSNLLLLLANNSFEHTVLILQSLLVSKNEKELKIEKVLPIIVARDTLNDVTTKLDDLRNAMLASYPNHSSVIEHLIQNGFNGDDLQKLRVICRKTGPLKLKEIADKFQKSGFSDIHHEMIAHRDKGNPDPAGSVRRVFTIQIAQSLEDIIKMLVVESYFWFDYVSYNNDLRKLTSQLDKMLSVFPVETGSSPQSYSL